MRLAHNEVGIIDVQENGSNLMGISLGFDFCAEHEWGSGGLRNLLGVSQLFDVMDFVENYAQTDSLAPKSIEDFKIKNPENMLLITANGKASEVPVKGAFDKGQLKQSINAYKDAYRQKSGKKNVPTPCATIAALTVMTSSALDYLIYELNKQSPELANKFKNRTSPKVDLSWEEFADFAKFFRDLGLYKSVVAGYQEEAERQGLEFKVPKWQDAKPTSVWDSKELLFVGYSSHDATIVEKLWQAAQNGNAYFGVKTSNNPFSRSSLNILTKDYSAEEKEEVKATWEAIRSFSKEICATGVLSTLKNANKTYYALSPKKMEDGEIKFFLNPREQSIYNHGWFTAEELIKWAKNEGPVLKANSSKDPNQ